MQAQRLTFIRALPGLCWDIRRFQPECRQIVGRETKFCVSTLSDARSQQLAQHRRNAMNRRITPLVALLLAIIYGAFSSGALAQTITGRISGTVTDASGAAIPGASIKITNANTDVIRTVMAG